jgi:hypothetical protein
MIDRVQKPRRMGAGQWVALPAWQHGALVLALWGVVWSIPAISLGLRAVGIPVAAFANGGEGERESSGEEPQTEAIGVVPARSRFLRDAELEELRAVRRMATVTGQGAKSLAGTRAPSVRCLGAAVSLPLRC